MSLINTVMIMINELIITEDRDLRTERFQHSCGGGSQQSEAYPGCHDGLSQSNNESRHVLTHTAATPQDHTMIITRVKVHHKALESLTLKGPVIRTRPLILKERR